MKNVMNLTPEEEFNQEVLWILEEIKKEQLATPKGEKVEFNIRILSKSGIPPIERQRKLLHKLQEWGVLRVEIGDVFYTGFGDEPKKYLLSINQQKFDKFYKKWGEIDENPWLSKESKVIQRKKLFDKQQEEAEVRAKEIERQFEELDEKQKAFEELGRQISSRIQKDFNLKQYEEVIKKIDEQAEPIKRALEQLDAVYSGSVQNSLTSVLQRLTESIKPIGEQMKRLKPLFEYPEYPKEAFISSDVIRVRQGAETISKLENIEALLQGLLSKDKEKPTQVEIIKPEEFKIKELEERLEKIVKLKKDEKKNKKKRVKETTLYLNQVGELYREPKDRYCYPMGEKSNRRQIVRFLATNRGYQLTEFISMELGIESEKTIRTEIGKIRKNIEKYLKIKCKDFLQGKKESGYRINPKYKVILKNE